MRSLLPPLSILLSCLLSYLLWRLFSMSGRTQRLAMTADEPSGATRAGPAVAGEITA